MKTLLLPRSICRLVVVATAIASVVMLGATSTANAGTTYTWNPTVLAASNWDNTTATGWNSGAGLFPGSAGDLTGGLVENDIANANTKAYTGSTSVVATNTANSTIHMNGVNAFLSEFDWGSTLNSTSAPFWTIDGAGATPGGSITFKALSGTATINSDFARRARQVYIQVPVAFTSNTNVNLTSVTGSTDFFGINGAVTGAGNLTINTPGTTGGGVFFIDNDMSGYTGTINFNSTGTVTTGNDRIGLLPANVNAHQASLVLSGSSALGQVGISTIELGALNGTGGNIHPYLDGAAATLKVGYKNNATDTYNGVLSGSVAGKAMSFEKAGTGIQVLGGANTYAGTTTVSGGTLLANNTSGSATGTGNVTVGSGATLGGTGAVSGTVTVSAGGTLSPGASIESLGTGSLTFSPSSTFKYEVNSTSVTADLLNAIGGSLSVGSGAALSLSDLGSSLLSDGTKFTMISYNGTWNGGTFASAPNLGLVTIGPKSFRIRYSDAVAGGNFAGETALNTTGRFVTLTAVPELGSFITMGLVGCCALGAVRLGKRFGVALL